jgi:hypothetical protein
VRDTDTHAIIIIIINTTTTTTTIIIIIITVKNTSTKGSLKPLLSAAGRPRAIYTFAPSTRKAKVTKSAGLHLGDKHVMAHHWRLQVPLPEQNHEHGEI